jgi:hypothetical protein
MRKAILMALFCLFCPVCLADVVHLKDGGVLEGKAVDTGKTIRLKLRHGYCEIPKEKVLFVERKTTREEEYRDRLAAIDPVEPKLLLDLARWCLRNSLVEEGRGLQKRARRLVVDREIAASKTGGADGLYRIACGCVQRGYESELVEYVARLILGMDPEHAGAHGLLGERKFRGTWLSEEVIRQLRAQEYEETMRLRGYIRYQGQWMKPETRNVLRELEEARKLKRKAEKAHEEVKAAALEADREKRRLARYREKLDGERAELDRLRKQIDRDAASLADLRARLLSEQARLEWAWRQLQEERRRLEEDRRRWLAKKRRWEKEHGGPRE